MNRVALLIGGNEGDRQRLLLQATELIRDRIGSVVSFSAVYETPPWGDFGGETPAPFLNQALLVDTPLAATDVLRQALHIEALLGRRRPARPRTHYSSRPMDIDIIFFNHDVIDLPDLQVPHPRMHLRTFVLQPLADIIPTYLHPTLHRTVADLLKSVSP